MGPTASRSRQAVRIRGVLAVVCVILSSCAIRLNNQEMHWLELRSSGFGKCICLSNNVPLTAFLPVFVWQLHPYCLQPALGQLQHIWCASRGAPNSAPQLPVQMVSQARVLKTGNDDNVSKYPPVNIERRISRRENAALPGPRRGHLSPRPSPQCRTGLCTVVATEQRNPLFLTRTLPLVSPCS